MCDERSYVVKGSPRKATRQEHAALISAALVKGVEAVIEAGHRLAIAQGELSRPEFLALLKEDLHISEATASKLMSIASHPVLSELSIGKVLPPNWTVLYALSQVPRHRLMSAIESGDIHPDMDREEVLALSREPIPAEKAIKVYAEVKPVETKPISIHYRVLPVEIGSTKTETEDSPEDSAEKRKAEFAEMEAEDSISTKTEDKTEAAVLRKLLPLTDDEIITVARVAVRRDISTALLDIRDPASRPKLFETLRSLLSQMEKNPGPLSDGLKRINKDELAAAIKNEKEMQAGRKH